MRFRLPKVAGPILFAMTVLAFLGLPFWQFSTMDWFVEHIDWFAQQHKAAARYCFFLALYLPLLVVAPLWSGFLVAWLAPPRLTQAYSEQGEGHMTKMRAGLLLVAAAVALTATVLVELAYRDWVTGAAIGAIADESEFALYHFYSFIEVPQLFLVLLWSAFLLIFWLGQGDARAVRSRPLLPIGCVLLAVTGVVWMEYRAWMAGAEMVSIANQSLSATAYRLLQALPALFVACLWVWFSGLLWSIRSPAHSRGSW